MSSMFGNMKTDDLEKAEDRLGGGRQRVPTDLYEADIKMLYITKSAKGAMAANVVAKLANGSDYEETIYFTNAKGEHYSINDNQKKVPLPGFVTVNNLCRVTVDKELFQLEPEDRQVKVYDFEEKKEVVKSLPVILELSGAKVLLAISEEKSNKSELQPDGKYKDLPTFWESNKIAHVFHLESGKTVNEIVDNKEALFAKSWVEKYKGKVNDRRKIKDDNANEAAKQGKPTTSGTPPQGTTASSSLFNRPEA